MKHKCRKSKQCISKLSVNMNNLLIKYIQQDSRETSARKIHIYALHGNHSFMLANEKCQTQMNI